MSRPSLYRITGESAGSSDYSASANHKNGRKSPDGHFAAVMHRVAHRQEDARRMFDLATMNILGRQYPGARAERFLKRMGLHGYASTSMAQRP